MAQIDIIRTLSFCLETTKEPLNLSYFTLVIPSRWQEMIATLKEFASQATKNPWPSTYALNHLLTALFPQLISVDQPKTDKVWLYSREIIRSDFLQMVFRTWLRAEYERLKVSFPTEINSEIFEIDLDWKTECKNLIADTHNKWNTADTIPEGFNLLPELLGESISDPKFNLEYKTNSLSFRRAPNPSGNGCELISWTPEVFRGSAYSLYLRFTLQTIPYQSFPVIHLNMGVKKWVSINDSRLGRGNHSVYLLTEFPGKNVTTHSRRFQVASIGWEKVGEHFNLTWNKLLPQLFEHIYPNNTLPTPEELQKHPLNYIDKSGLQAAISYHVTMPAWQHEVSNGLPPLDKRNLSQQIASKLFDSYKLIYSEAPRRVNGFSIQNKKNVFSASETTDIKRLQTDSDCRKAIAQTVGTNLRVEIWYQSEIVRNELFKTVAQTFGFDLPLNYDLSEGHRFHSENLSVQIQFYELGDLANPLDCQNKSDKEREQALRTRADQVSKIIAPSSGGDATVIGSFVELLGSGDYESYKDPKDAIRMGQAKTSRFTQFITPNEEQIKHRAKMAVLDLLRQFGVLSGTPSYGKKNFKKAINYAAFWVYNPRDSKLLLPMFLHISGETGQISATAFGMGEFLPYPKFLMSLGNSNKIKMLGNNEKWKVPGIIKTWLNKVCDGSDLMMMASAQNARNLWGWLKNPQIAIDKVFFDNDQENSISELKGLRILRIRESRDGETPEFYAFKEMENGKPNTDKVSFTQGLFALSDRVFYSVGSKPKQRSKLSRLATKTNRPDLQAWNPRIIELTSAYLQSGDDPRFWAMLAHRLRDSAVQSDEPLSLPLPLHLLKTAADEYAKIGMLLSKI